MVQKRYLDYIDEVKEDYENRLLEFFNITDLDKFNPNSNLKFKDKTYVKSWFSLDKLEEYEGGQYDRIVSEYNEYRKMRKERLKKRHSTVFEKRKLEFIEEQSLEKFSRSSCISFKDGTLMCNWFRTNKKDIFESSDEGLKIIVKQYNSYKSGEKIIYVDSEKETMNKKA